MGFEPMLPATHQLAWDSGNSLGFIYWKKEIVKTRRLEDLNHFSRAGCSFQACPSRIPRSQKIQRNSWLQNFDPRMLKSCYHIEHRPELKYVLLAHFWLKAHCAGHWPQRVWVGKKKTWSLGQILADVRKQLVRVWSVKQWMVIIFLQASLLKKSLWIESLSSLSQSKTVQVFTWISDVPFIFHHFGCNDRKALSAVLISKTFLLNPLNFIFTWKKIVVITVQNLQSLKFA